MQKILISDKYLDNKESIESIIQNFENYKEILGNPERNIIKKISWNNHFIAVKSFKKPHLINKIAYKYFRKSKARRSYEHGEKLLTLGIDNPEPIAYIENFDLIGITSSYYISIYSPYDFTIREVYQQNDAYECVKEYAKFSNFVHNKGVYIKDNTPGNTLVKRLGNNKYKMSLVDLNRMKFYDDLTFDIKMKSLSNNIKEQPFLDIFIEEYAKNSGYNFKDIKNKMSFYQNKFNKRIESKAKFKKSIKKLLHFINKK